MKEKTNIIILTGPTGVGKTNLSINLAKILNTDIISCDSMQVYTGMDIGTDKIMPDNMQGVRHYNLDIANPDKVFSVQEFSKITKSIIDELSSKGKIPLLVGGSGLYIDSIIYDLDFGIKSNPLIREKLEAQLKAEGIDVLANRLKSIDFEYASNIDLMNPRRVVRGLEIAEITKDKPSKYLNRKNLRRRNENYEYYYFVLNSDRNLLYENINIRVDQMVEKGLLDEVTKLYNRYPNTDSALFTAIGYKEIISMLQGEISEQEAIDLIKKNSRNYAKRQLTWFRREENAIWIDKDSMTDKEILEFIIDKIEFDKR